MPEQAHSRVLAEVRPNGTELNEAELPQERLRELRRLILGPEMAQLAKLGKRLDDPEQRVEDLAAILPAARIRKVLEQLIRAIVKYDRDMVADVVGQILPGAVKNAVTHAFREFSERLNEITEKRFSLRALSWRFEAFRTGKPFSEIVLLRSLLYSVREVFLIHSKSGVLLQEAARPEAVTKDSDSISSMFSAFQEFVHDSFIGTESNEIETIELGSFKFVIQHGRRSMIAGAVDGGAPAALKNVFRAALEEIENDFAKDLTAFDGDVAPFVRARPILERCLLGASGPKPRRSFVPWLIAGAAVAALVTWGVVSLVERHRWDSYVDLLRSEPGIVITGQGMSGSQHVVFGMRDAMARDPLALLAGSGIPAAQVKLQMEPYFSLDPRFAIVRDFERQKDEIENDLIRFTSGSSEITEAEQDHVETVARQFRSLNGTARLLHKTVQVRITGHTDDIGSEVLNSDLSQNRADTVAGALKAAGVESWLLTTRGVATAEPVRSGSSDRVRSYNRSVSFRVESGP
jgi:OOP family OmpA-OmpF porin